jgi:hypothetical protein
LEELAASIFYRTKWRYILETIIFMLIAQRISNLTKYYIALKVKLSPSLINQTPRHDDVRGSEVVGQLFLTSALGRDEWSFSHPCHLPSGK